MINPFYALELNFVGEPTQKLPSSPGSCEILINNWFPHIWGKLFREGEFDGFRIVESLLKCCLLIFVIGELCILPLRQDQSGGKMNH